VDSSSRSRPGRAPGAFPGPLAAGAPLRGDQVAPERVPCRPAGGIGGEWAGNRPFAFSGAFGADQGGRTPVSSSCLQPAARPAQRVEPSGSRFPCGFAGNFHKKNRSFGGVIRPGRRAARGRGPAPARQRHGGPAAGLDYLASFAGPSVSIGSYPFPGPSRRRAWFNRHQQTGRWARGHPSLPARTSSIIKPRLARGDHAVAAGAGAKAPGFSGWPGLALLMTDPEAGGWSGGCPPSPGVSVEPRTIRQSSESVAAAARPGTGVPHPAPRLPRPRAELAGWAMNFNPRPPVLDVPYKERALFYSTLTSSP